MKGMAGLPAVAGLLMLAGSTSAEPPTPIGTFDPAVRPPEAPPGPLPIFATTMLAEPPTCAVYSSSTRLASTGISSCGCSAVSRKTWVSGTVPARNGSPCFSYSTPS